MVWVLELRKWPFVPKSTTSKKHSKEAALDRLTKRTFISQPTAQPQNKSNTATTMMMNEKIHHLRFKPEGISPSTPRARSLNVYKTKSSWTLRLSGFLWAGFVVSNMNAASDNACVSMCTGVYTSTCIAYGNDRLPLPSGIMNANAISVPGGEKDGGIDYFLLSTDPDYLGLEWREHGHYSLQDMSPSPLENCAGSLDLQAWDDRYGEWVPFHFDMEWNTNDGAKSFYLSTAIGFNCHYVKIADVNECRDTYSSIVTAFHEKDIEPEIPSADDLCGPPPNEEDLQQLLAEYGTTTSDAEMPHHTSLLGLAFSLRLATFVDGIL